jgi:hypothetical protein
MQSRKITQADLRRALEALRRAGRLIRRRPPAPTVPRRRPRGRGGYVSLAGLMARLGLST